MNQFYPQYTVPSTMDLMNFDLIQKNMLQFESMLRIRLSQEQMMRSRLLSLMYMQAQVLGNATKIEPGQQNMEIKREDSFSASCSSLGTSPLVKLTNTNKPEQLKNLKKINVSSDDKENICGAKGTKLPYCKNELHDMISFLLDNIGKTDQAEIEKARRRYAQNVYLLPVFDVLVEKYSPIRKHREDIVRYIIRKAFKFLKKNNLNSNKNKKLQGKRAYAALCKKYFHFDPRKLEEQGVNVKDEKQLIEFLLPYRSKSKNRTMNTSFIQEIFSSKEFCEDYKIFLNSLENILVQDNNKKIQDLVILADYCILNNCPEKIKKNTRLPWLQIWIDKTRKIAFDLLDSEITKEQVASATTVDMTQKLLKTEAI